MSAQAADNWAQLGTMHRDVWAVSASPARCTIRATAPLDVSVTYGSHVYRDQAACACSAPDRMLAPTGLCPLGTHASRPQYCLVVTAL